MRDPVLAGILSLIIPGVGQLYNGQILWGILWLIFTPGFIASFRRLCFVPSTAFLALIHLRPSLGFLRYNPLRRRRTRFRHDHDGC